MSDHVLGDERLQEIWDFYHSRGKLGEAVAHDEIEMMVDELSVTRYELRERRAADALPVEARIAAAFRAPETAPCPVCEGRGEVLKPATADRR